MRWRRRTSTGLPIFLGAGAYDRIVPSAIGAIISRGEYLTCYTPYQPEISQGTLQSIFEFQSMISELTGLEISNASVYDGANAVVEAALMTARLTKRDPKVAVSPGLNPRYREVMETYRVEVVDLRFERRDHGLLRCPRRRLRRLRAEPQLLRGRGGHRGRLRGGARCGSALASRCATRSRSPSSKRRETSVLTWRWVRHSRSGCP